MELKALVSWLDQELNTAGIADYSGAVNGLQLENGGTVTKVAAAVDASLPVIEKAVAMGADLLIVHHGMFWQGCQPVRGAFYQKLKTAMDAGLAIYSSHLPLDVHPQWGNNVQLARALGITETKPFLEMKGMPLGLRAEGEWTRQDLLTLVREVVGGAVHVCPGGPEIVRSVGICTGGAGSEVAAVAAAGVDTFLTGEGPHWSYPLAEELGVNIFYAGHYATETFGVKALAAELETRFGLPWTFLDHPTGL